MVGDLDGVEAGGGHALELLGALVEGLGVDERAEGVICFVRDK